MPTPSPDLLLRLARALGVAPLGTPTPARVGAVDPSAPSAAAPAPAPPEPTPDARIRDRLLRLVADGYVVCTACRSLVQVARFAAPDPSCRQCGGDLGRPNSVRSPVTGETSRVPVAAPDAPVDPRASQPTLMAIRADDDTRVPAGEKKTGQTAAPRVGRPFGPYMIREEISRGGMGVVYRAFDPKLNREIALKLLLAGGLATAEQVERFQREARAAARLHHPNIVPLHDVGVQDGVHYLTMDFIRGIPLDRLLEERKVVPPSIALKIVRDVSYALHYAHHQGVVHRDVKPGNVILAFEEALTEAAVLETGDRSHARRFLPPFRAMITDFGLAKERNQSSSLTESGMAMGTPHYMSPEQARGDYDKLDGRTDIYSLGVVLYEMLTGVKPFEAATVVDLMMKVVVEEPVPPRDRNPLLGRAVETICLRAMAKDRGDRYSSALELVQDIEAQLAGEEIAAQPLGFLYYTLSSLRRNRQQAITAAVTAALVLGLVIWFSWVRPWWGERRAHAAEAERRAFALAHERTETARAEAMLAQVRAWVGEGKQEQVASLLANSLPRLGEVPAAAALWRIYGESQSAMGSVDSALAAYAEAVVRGAGGDEAAEAWLGIADLLSRAGRHQDVEPIVERVLRESPRLSARPALQDLRARLRLARLDVAGAVEAYALARESSAGGPGGLSATEAGEAWCRRLVGAAFVDLPGPAFCAASIPGGEGRPPRLFLGGTEGLFVVDGTLAPAGGGRARDRSVRWAARPVPLALEGVVAGLAVCPAARGRRGLLLVLEWRGSAECSRLHVLRDGANGLRAEQVVLVMPVAGPAGVGVCAADFDGDGSLEVFVRSQGPRDRLQAWKERSGILAPWFPDFLPERIDLPLGSLSPLEGPDPSLLEAAWCGSRTLVREWRWDAERGAFLRRDEFRRELPVTVAPIPGSDPGDRPVGFVIAGPDGPEARGVRTADPRSRAGVEFLLRTADGWETGLTQRAPQHEPNRFDEPQAAAVRGTAGRFVAVHLAAETSAVRRLWFLDVDSAAPLRPLEVILPARERCTLLAAIDVNADGNDELLLQLDDGLRIVGRSPWPRHEPTVERSTDDGKERSAGPPVLDPRPAGRAQARLRAAADLARLGFGPAARRILEALAWAARGGPSAHVPLLALADACERTGDVRAALSAYNRALQGAEHADDEALFGRARVLDRLGECEEAAREFADLVERAALDPHRLAELEPRRREAESRARFVPFLEDRFESSDGPVALTSPFPYAWDREHFLLDLDPSSPEEHAAYLSADSSGCGWRVEAEWNERAGAAAPGYSFGCWQGALPQVPVRGGRVRFFLEPGPVVAQGWAVLEGGPGFTRARALPVTLPTAEWIRASIEYHPVDRRLEARIRTRSGAELAVLELPECGEPMVGSVHAGVWISRSAKAGAPTARIGVNYVRLEGDPGRLRAAKTEEGSARAACHRASRLLVGHERARAAEAYGAAAVREEPPADLALAEIHAAWMHDPERGARLLARHAFLQPTALARAAERLLEIPNDDFLAFLLRRWPDAGMDPRDPAALGAIESLLRRGHAFESFAILSRLAENPEAPLVVHAALARTALRLGQHGRAAQDLSAVLLASAKTPLSPDAVDWVARGLVALDDAYPNGAVATFLRTHHVHRRVRVREVTPDGPADRAGLRAGDHLLTLDGEPVPGADAFLERVNSGPDRPLRVQARRGEELLEFELSGRPPGLRLDEKYGVGTR